MTERDDREERRVQQAQAAEMPDAVLIGECARRGWTVTREGEAVALIYDAQSQRYYRGQAE